MQWTDAIKQQVNALKPVELNAALACRVFGLIDLTSLNHFDTEADIAALLQKTRSPLGHVAALCIYPRFVRMAAAALNDTAIKTATVINFPGGDETLEKVLVDINGAIQDGAQEIDVVFPYTRFLAGERQYAHQFIAACKAACGGEIILKVILETGAMPDFSAIAKAAFLALTAGADFIKTSTGKISTGATLEAAAVMLLVIREYTASSKRKVGIKVSGGIRELGQAAQYLALADNIMGGEWATPVTFRIGASNAFV